MNNDDIYENCIYSRSENNSSTVVYEGDISGFHCLEALNDQFEAKYFHNSFFTPHQTF